MSGSDTGDGDDSEPTQKETVSRRGYLRTGLAIGAVGLTSSLAGCQGNGGGEGTTEGNGGTQGTVPEGTPSTVETQYWHDWGNIDADSPPLDYSASAGSTLDPAPVEFSSEDDPWMREHALMIQRGLSDLGVPVELNDRPLNQLYAQSWNTPGLEAVVSMSTHGPDPQRGLDPNPLMMRRHNENPSNYDNYWNPELNDVLEEQRTVTGDQAARKELVDTAQEMFAEDIGGIISLFPDVITAANTSKWSGYVMTPGNGPTKDSFQWTEVNLQPETDETTFIKGTTTAMNSVNLPWAAGGAEEKRLKYIYDGLFDATPDLEVVPALATDATYTDDTTVEVKLREGVTWHDGEPFTAEDVKFTVDLYKSETSTSQTAFYEPIESVDVIDDHTVQMNLKRPDAAFMTQRVVRSIIIPKHKWEDVDTPSQYNPENPIGTGPFQYVDWQQGTRFEVERNDGHWMFDDDWRADTLGDQAASGSGIDRVVWVNIGNVDSLIGALQQGKIDAIAGTLSNAQADRAAATSGVEKLVAKNFAPLDVKLMHSAPLVRDKEFRVAFAKATAKDNFVETVLQGRATVPPGENPISPLSVWHNSNTKDYGYDPEGAKEILRKAGYTWDGDGNLQYPSGEAWAAFVERVQNENTHKRRAELNQPDFS